ncbi:MAG: hypothetical protein KatS3mg049_1040 [Caldilinea sp.]|jgi:hypothetical protein|nr:MAG: hypothetical protein KatS3mg049_1040 [Caldilinea sp.]
MQLYCTLKFGQYAYHENSLLTKSQIHIIL